MRADYFALFNALSPTLDGKPATLCGRLEHFPRLRALDHSLDIVLSWGLVARCVSEGKAHLKTR